MHGSFRPCAAVLVFFAWQAQACVMDPAFDETGSIESELGAEPGIEETLEPGEGPVAAAGCGDGICSADETDVSCGPDCGCSAAADLCGTFTPAPIGCWCDADCAEVGDCCADVDVCELSQAPDGGQGAPCEWGEKEAGFFEAIDLKGYQWKYELAAWAGGVLADAPQAREYLEHFLGNSGDELDVDVDQMLADVPSFAEAVKQDRVRFAQETAVRAEETGVTEMGQPVPDVWEAHATNSDESFNWYFALGSWNYNQTGTVTTQAAGDQWAYSVETSVHVSKHYDWDPNKKVGPLGIFDQSELAALHCYGWAQEFWIRGEGDISTLEGTTP